MSNERDAAGSCPCKTYVPAPGAAWPWCDACGWRGDLHPESPMGRAVARIVGPVGGDR